MEKNEKAKEQPADAADADPSPTWKTLDFQQKYKYLLKNVTVEPILACYVMPCVLAALATQNLYLEKACRANLRYDDRVCAALSARDVANHTAEETAVQLLVVEMSIWKSALQSALPALLILFMGSWSDRRGRRKPFLLLPIVGELLTCLALLVCTYYMTELPMQVAGVAEVIFPALTGGWMTMFMATFSYIADITTVKMRTFRIGIANLFFSLGIPVGTALSGVLLKYIGFYGVFSVASVLYVMALAYGSLKIREVRKAMPRDEGVGFLGDFFDVRHVTDTLRVAFKEGEGRRRVKMLSMMVLTFVIVGPMYGTQNVFYLYTRYRFGWDEVDFSLYMTFSFIVDLVGTMIGILIFSKVMHMEDTLIGLVACVSSIAANFVYAFSPTSTAFCLAPLVNILGGMGFIAMRSIASKMVTTDELGKVNSLLGVCEALAPLLYGPLYSFVYAQTIHVMPGAFFLIGSLFLLPAVVIFTWLYILHRQDILTSYEEEGTFKYTLSPINDGRLKGIYFINDGYVTDDSDIPNANKTEK